MQIDFIRHGQTEYNKDHIPMGRLDIPLNQTGINQLMQRSEELIFKKYDIIFCSPLKRAYKSAQIIAKNQNCKVRRDKRLIERDLGELAGTSYKHLDGCKHWNWIIGSNTNSAVKAENIDEMILRISSFLKYIKSKYKGKSVLIVSHDSVGRTINAIVNKLPKSTDLLNLYIQNAQVLTFNI